MEDERQKAETFLKSLSDLSQKICRLWPLGVVSVSAELDKHLDELNDGVDLFLGLPCSWKKEYKRKAGEVVVNSGLIALLCKKATPWLEDKQGDDVTRVIWALYLCMGTAILLKRDGDLHRLLPLMVNLLKESFLDHMAGTLQQGGDETLIHSLGVLSGLARVEENNQHLRDLPNIQSVLRAYSRSENEWMYHYAVIPVARLETERRAEILSPNHGVVQFLLGQLKALEREGFNPQDLKLQGAVTAVGIVTYNPGNCELLVQEGVLSYLEKGLVNCVSENKCKEWPTCSIIVITLQNLACVDRNKAEIMKHTQLLDSLFSISIDQSHSHRLGCIESAKYALSNLGMNPQDLQNDGTRRTGLLDMSSETKDSGRKIPMSAPQRMDSSGTHGIMHNSHGGLMTPSFEMTGGAPVLGMMGHEPNTTMLSDPRNAPKSISGNIRPEEETLNVGSSQVGSCTQIDLNSSSTVPMDSDMDNEQLSTIDSSSIRPIPSLPVVFSTESSMINTAPFSGNTAVSTSRSATAKSSSTETVQQGSLSPGPSSTAGNSSSHAPPAISMSTTGGGLPSSSTLAKPSSPIVPGIGPDFSVLTHSPYEPLNLNNPQLPLFHESNLYTPCPPSVSSESASTPRSPDQQHSITSPESRGSFTSQPSPGHGVTTSEHAQEGFSAPPSPPHSGLPPAMNQEGSSLYRPGEQNNNFMKTHAGEARTCRFIFKADGKPAVREQINNCRKTDAREAQTCRIIFKADGKPAALPSNPESESSSKAQNRAQRTVSSSKSSNKRAKLLPKLETVFSDGANCLPQTAASSSKSKNKRTKLSSNPVTESSSRDTRIDRDMETEALETTSVTPLSTTILKAEGKRPRHYRNPKGGASSQSKVPPSHAGGILNQFQKSVQNCQPPFKVSRDSPCRDEVPSNPCKSPQQNSDTEQQNCTKKRHTCPCCPKYFISRGDLKAHLKQERHFKCKKCKECEKRFSYKKTLAKHVKDKHDPENESSYKCMVCDKEFGCERYMKEHEKVHGEHAYERYKCRKCEKGFPYRSILNKHMKSCR